MNGALLRNNRDQGREIFHEEFIHVKCDPGNVAKIIETCVAHLYTGCTKCLEAVLNCTSFQRFQKQLHSR